MISNIEAKDIYKHLQRYGQSLKINSVLAEDLIQDTLEKAVTSFKDGNLVNWCFSVLKNKYIDHCRHNATINKNFLSILEYQNPEQEYVVALKEASVLPEFNLSLENILGTPMHELGLQSVVHKKLHKFYSNKEMYV